MAGNSNLHDSRSNRADEFYTQLSTIEDELCAYEEHFRGKTVLCNADDPYESNFFKYFAMNFNYLGLKKLIATCYSGSPVQGNQLPLFDVEALEDTPDDGRAPYKIEISHVEDHTGDGAVGIADVEWLIKNKGNTLSILSGSGDFRSKECMELLDEADIVCTNPPFSLMKEYLPLLVEKGKDFLVLGNINHATYSEIFPYILDEKMWLGNHAGHFWFNVPDHYEPKKTDYREVNGQKQRRMGNICWFTNLDTPKHHEPLELYREYNPDEYPKLDNYDAIFVRMTADIPIDYDGVMCVPITYLPYHCPEQFEIVGEFKHGQDGPFDLAVPYLDGKAKYNRLAIRAIRG